MEPDKKNDQSVSSDQQKNSGQITPESPELGNPTASSNAANEAPSLAPEPQMKVVSPTVPPAPETTPSPTTDQPIAPPPQENVQPTSETSKPVEPFTSPTPSATNTTPLASSSVILPQPSKRPRKRIFIVLLIFILAIVAGAYGYYYYSKHATKKPAHIKVGVMMAFSGGSSSMGYGAMKGVQLAKKQLGADNIDIVQMDSKCDPKAAVDAIKRLLAQKVAAIIGEGCSSASVAALPLANNSKTPMISPSASSTTLSIPDDYFFRVVPPDTFQGAFDAQAIYDRGIRTAAVFYTNEPYGTSMNKVFQEKFEGLGGKIVATASAQPDVIDLTDQMNELKAAKPQSIFIAPNSVVSGTAAMKIGRQLGISAPYFGADILYNKTIIDNAPTAVEGLTITSFPTGTKAFKQALLNEYGVAEQLYAAPQAYDALHAIYLATQKGAKTGEEIKSILPTLSFDGVSAHIKFDQNGEISDKSYKYDLLQIKNGAFVTLDQ